MYDVQYEYRYDVLYDEFSFQYRYAFLYHTVGLQQNRSFGPKKLNSELQVKSRTFVRVRSGDK